VNVNFLSTWICLSVFLYVLFIYMYVGVETVTPPKKEKQWNWNSRLKVQNTWLWERRWRSKFERSWKIWSKRTKTLHQCSASWTKQKQSPWAITLSSLEQMLLFISDPKGHSKHSRWSAISKLMQPKRVMCDSQESNTNEFEKVDAALQSLISLKPSSIENFESHMENLELCIQDLEIGVDQLSRKLIRNRVSLLNIFNH